MAQHGPKAAASTRSSPSTVAGIDKTVPGLSAAEAFGPALAAVRAGWHLDRLAFARAAGLSVRSLQRWERDGVQPRPRERAQLLAMVAHREHAAAMRLASALGVQPPPDPTPAAPPPVVAPPPPPIPDELAIDPVEGALFRAAESLGMSAAALRPALARFLGHLEALGVTAADARTRIGG